MILCNEQANAGRRRLLSLFPFLCTCVSGEAISLLVNLTVVSLSRAISLLLLLLLLLPYLTYLSDHTIVHLFALLMIFALLTSISSSHYVWTLWTFRSSCSLNEHTHARTHAQLRIWTKHLHSSSSTFEYIKNWINQDRSNVRSIDRRWSSCFNSQWYFDLIHWQEAFLSPIVRGSDERRRRRRLFTWRIFTKLCRRFSRGCHLSFSLSLSSSLITWSIPCPVNKHHLICLTIEIIFDQYAQVWTGSTTNLRGGRCDT